MRGDRPMPTRLVMLRIVAPHFVAGVHVEPDFTIGETAPIVKYMKGWSVTAVREYCRRKDWLAEAMYEPIEES